MASIIELLPFIVTMLAAGALAGFVAGLFGIGGGFVVVPTLAAVFSLVSTGGGATTNDHIMHVAIGTSLATIIFTSLRSVQSHAKRGAVDFDILKSWAPYVVLGVGVGLVIARYMNGQGLSLIFGIGVFVMAWHFLFPVLAKRAPVSPTMPTGMLRGGLGSFLGGMCALLGIGGGTPAVLIMTLSGQPMHRAVATAAGFGTLIAIPGAIGSVIIGLGEEGLPYGSIGYVNLIALVGIAGMSVLTAPVGVAVAHSLDPMRLRKVFGIYLLVTSSLMLFNAFSAGGHKEEIPAISDISATTIDEGVQKNGI
ncbi:sulfite exporter TauE/SafE family protein [Henriciella aquimarina]|uniref:sulfite exporter TauE/SafE family protein n=1 Tax=Henriciella aquimarina TaxID=545261 RepID=UPI000A032BCE|nr:sulfite exporter TauE/SafE family protein [Henriciella aquimarina]